MTILNCSLVRTLWWLVIPSLLAIYIQRSPVIDISALVDIVEQSLLPSRPSPTSSLQLFTLSFQNLSPPSSPPPSLFTISSPPLDGRLTQCPIQPPHLPSPTTLSQNWLARTPPHRPVPCATTSASSKKNQTSSQSRSRHQGAHLPSLPCAHLHLPTPHFVESLPHPFSPPQTTSRLAPVSALSLPRAS